jgi:hypothetical protein
LNKLEKLQFFITNEHGKKVVTEEMIVTILLQTYNELESGHLERFVKWNKVLADNLVALDDQSTDNTKSYLLAEFDLVLQTKVRSFNSELYNKQLLLDAAKSRFPETDWFLWLDADELLLLSRSELNLLITEAEANGYDSISLPLVNLWKSEHYYRVDSKFDDLVNIRLWKNTDKLYYNPTPGLHQPLHPLGLISTLKEDRFKVLHFGFASFDLIVKKFATYSSLGQRGDGLWRLVDESTLEVKHIDSRFDQLGNRVKDYYLLSDYSANVTKNSIYEYFWAARALNLKLPATKVKITLISLIYSGIDWLEFQYGELLKLASELPPGEVEVLFVANDASPDVIAYLDNNGIPYVVSPGRSSASEWYINSVYRSYNFGVTHAKGEYVLLTNSDMAYSEGFLYSMIMESDPNTYLVGKLIESGRLKPADAAIKKNLGKNLQNFKRASFNNHVARLRKRGLEDGGLYMPALLHRRTFLKFSGYPEGNIKQGSLNGYLAGLPFEFALPGDDLIPGDRAFMQLLNQSSIEHKTNLNSLCYHFQEGEKSEYSSQSASKTTSGIAIANDRLIGINYEKTLWNFLIEDLESLKFRVLKVELGTGTRLPYRFSARQLFVKPTARVLFRNATFLRKIKGPWRQIVLVQDSISSKRILKNQIFARQNALSEITNSQTFISNLIFPPGHHQYLLPLPIDSTWESTLDVNHRKESDTVQAIFIGAFNDTKGWEQIKPLVEKNKSIKFLLISKYADDESGLHSNIGPNWEIKRNLDTAQLIEEVDKSHFLILGSPFETQCLVAIECASRNIPVLMKKTGLLATLPHQDLASIGFFVEDIEEGFTAMLRKLKDSPNELQPRKIIQKYGLDSAGLRAEWINVLVKELQLSFIPQTPDPLLVSIKKKIPNRIKIRIKEILGVLASKPLRVQGGSTRDR